MASVPWYLDEEKLEAEFRASLGPTPGRITREITVDMATLRRLTEQLGDWDDLIEGILVKAVRAGQGAARKEMIRRTAAETGLTQGTIRERVWGTRYRVSKLVARVRGGKIGWPLRNFEPTQTRAGVRLNIAGGRSLVAHAFIPRRKGKVIMGGHVFRRVGSGRLPIELLRTDDVTTAILERSGEQVVIAAAREAVNRSIEQQVAKLGTRRTA